MATDRLRDFLHEYVMTDDQLQEVYDRFGREIHKGLKKETQPKAETKCFVTYVQDLPTGEETGQYLAIDLGGSNFRIQLITLKGQGEVEQTSKSFPLPENVIHGPGKKLFDYIAQCLSDFVSENDLCDEHLPLGFTFSFAVFQESISRATLVRWTKGVNNTGVVNKDVGRLLQEAIERRGNLKIEIVAIVNDTTGTLMSCAYRHPSCRVGLIVGTGVNACYTELSTNAEFLDEKYHNKKHIIINIELGGFGDNGNLDFIRTDTDQLIDKKSVNKKAIFEKMISGMYLGEIVRLILVRAVRENLMFTPCSIKTKIGDLLASKENLILTRHLTEAESDRTPDLVKTKRILTEIFGLQKPLFEDCQRFNLVCSIVTRRAGNLIGVALSFLLNKMLEPNVIIAVDGTVYRMHPKLDMYIRESMEKFTSPTVTYDLVISEDGSGRGAALVVATAVSKRNSRSS